MAGDGDRSSDRLAPRGSRRWQPRRRGGDGAGRQGQGGHGCDAYLVANIEKTESMLLGQRGHEAAALQSRTTRSCWAAARSPRCWLDAGDLADPQHHAPAGRGRGLAQRVAQGDLSCDIVVRSQDETGQLMAALRDMNTALVSIVGEVRGGTDTIATAPPDRRRDHGLVIAHGQQASSLEETALSMEELTAAVKRMRTMRWRCARCPRRRLPWLSREGVIVRSGADLGFDQ